MLLATLVPIHVATGQVVDSARARFPVKAEIRADGIFARKDPRTVLQLGVGGFVAAGSYARVGLIGGAGAASGGASARLEGVLRFHTDPWAERGWAPYASLGAGVLWAAHTRSPFLLTAIGFDGPRSRGWRPAFELGFSRGLRVAVIARTR